MTRLTRTQIDRRAFLRGSGLLGAGLMAGIPLLGGCGSDGRTGSGGGMKLTFGVAMPVTSFDPYTHNTYITVNTLYSYLIDYDKDLTPVPNLAESWEVARDSTSLTIHLREATFHSGVPITAGDVVAGIERAQDPDRAFNQRPAAAFIDTAEVVDERTVRVNCKEPTSEGTMTDWMFVFPIVAADANDPEALQNEPAGSGPFRYSSYEKGRRLVLTKNPRWWEDGKPYLDEIEFRLYDDQDSLVAGLEAEELDGAIYVAARHVEPSGQ